jgi:hypothetical protein
MFKDIIIINKPLVEGCPCIINALLPLRHQLSWRFKYKGKEYGDYIIEDIKENVSVKKQIKLMEEMVKQMKRLAKASKRGF